MHVLEEPRRLSESLLWRLTTQFYERQGAAAWTDGVVPSGISCNAFIANAYAQIIVGYLQDVGEEREGARVADTAVTVLELGAGAGDFGFLVVRAALDAVAAHGPGFSGSRFRYVMTDVAESNVHGWMANPRVRALVDAGIMDLAVLDVTAPAAARSLVSGKSLPEIINGDPVVMIANYVFDSSIIDAFRVEAGKLFEVKVGLELREEVVEVVGSSELFRKLHFKQQMAPITWPYYPEPIFDSIINSYASDLNEATLLFPVAALRCIDAVRALAQGNLLLLLSDKARSSVAHLEGHKGLSLTLTGTFSSTVNVDAFARWFAAQGGTVKMPMPAQEHFDTFGLLFGKIGEHGATEAAFEKHVRSFGPAAYWGIAREIMNTNPRLGPRAMLGLLALSRYDPYFIMRTEDSLLDAIGKSKAEEKEQFVAALEKSLERIYSDDRDVFFTLGRLFQRLGEERRALTCYAESIRKHGKRSSIFYNMSVCHGELGNRDEALDWFRQAVELTNS